MRSFIEVNDLRQPIAESAVVPVYDQLWNLVRHPERHQSPGLWQYRSSQHQFRHRAQCQFLFPLPSNLRVYLCAISLRSNHPTCVSQSM